MLGHARTHARRQVTVVLGGAGKTMEEVALLRHRLVPLGMAVDCIIDRDVEMSDVARRHLDEAGKAAAPKGRSMLGSFFG